MYEDAYNKLLAKKLSKSKDPAKTLKRELNSIGHRATQLHAAKSAMSDHFEGVLKILSSVFPLDLKDPNLIGTSDRVARAWIEMISGLGIDESEIFSTSFPSEKYDQIIVLKNIHYTSLCSHHFLPFTGKVTVGYLPRLKGKSQVCGISKLARVVDVFAKRPQLQERMCYGIQEAITKALKPKGAIVVTTGHHHCMSCRGVEKAGSDMITSAVSGLFKEPSLKHEFFELLKVHG